MMTIVNLLIISFLMVFIIDLSGIVTEAEKGLAKWLKVKSVKIPKPFSCSLCMTWWSTLIYCIVIQQFTIPMIGLCGLLAYLTPVWYVTLLFLKTLGEKMIGLLFYLMGER